MFRRCGVTAAPTGRAHRSTCCSGTRGAGGARPGRPEARPAAAPVGTALHCSHALRGCSPVPRIRVREPRAHQADLERSVAMRWPPRCPGCKPRAWCEPDSPCVPGAAYSTPGRAWTGSPASASTGLPSPASGPGAPRRTLGRRARRTDRRGLGLIVTPGLVDLHTHLYEGVSHYGIDPDTYCLGRGVTTAVDAGSSGAQTFPGLRRYVIGRSRTRVLAFLHIAVQGMITNIVGELEDLRWASVAQAIDAGARAPGRHHRHQGPPRLPDGGK